MTDYYDDYDYDETASQDWDLDALAQRVREQSVLGAPDPQSSRRLALLQLVERSIAEVPAARQGASERAVQGALDAWQATSTPIRAHNRSRNRASWRALLMSGGTIAAIAIGVVGLISVFRQHESDRNIAFSSAASTTTRDASASKSIDNASTPNQASAGTGAAGETSAAASSPPAARDLESSLTGQNTVRDLGTVNNLQDALNRWIRAAEIGELIENDDYGMVACGLVGKERECSLPGAEFILGGKRSGVGRGGCNSDTKRGQFFLRRHL